MKNIKLSYLFGFLLAAFFCNAQAQQMNTAKLDSFFNALSANNQAMGSFLIAKDGKSIYQKVTGYSQIEGDKKTPATLETKYRIGSITKTFTAVMIFQLIDEKKLSLDTRLSKFFPNMPNATRITIGNLLNHTSGLTDFVDENRDWITDPHSKAELLDKIAEVKPNFEPGTNQKYSNGGYLLLGYILEKITGKTYEHTLKQRILKKIGLKSTIAGTINNSHKLEARPYSFNETWIPVKDIYFPDVIGVGDILSTPQDLMVFINALTSGKLVSTKSYNKMSTFTGPEMFGMGLLEAPYEGKTLIGHNGGTFASISNMYAIPNEGMSFVFTTNAMNYRMNDITLSILAAYYNKPYLVPVHLQTEELDALLGNYSSQEMSLKISITRLGSVLMAQATGQDAFSLDALSKDEFKREQFGLMLKFDREKHEMTLVQGGKHFRYVLKGAD